MKSLIGKVALVTGGSRGIGEAIVKKLANLGAIVVFSYQNSAEKANQLVELLAKQGHRAIALKANNANVEELQKVIKTTQQEFGQIDILVNNAGILIAKEVNDLTLNDLDTTLNINVKAVFIASQAVASQMPTGGRIISIGSNLAERVPMSGMSLYSLSKSALIGLTKGLARDLGKRGITVNLIQPGSTNTDMNPASGEFADAQRNLMSIPKFGEPNDIANLVAWLASEQSQYVTGSAITIDGGANA